MFYNVSNILGGGDSWVCDPTTGAPVVVKLGAGTNQTASFTLPSLEYGYEVWVDSKEGVAPPKYNPAVQLDTSTMVCIITIPIITSDQLLTADSKVHIKMRIVK